MQEWADHLPPSDYLDVRGRLRGKDASEQASAFLELYLGTALAETRSTAQVTGQSARRCQ